MLKKVKWIVFTIVILIFILIAFFVINKNQKKNSSTKTAVIATYINDWNKANDVVNAEVLKKFPTVKNVLYSKDIMGQDGDNYTVFTKKNWSDIMDFTNSINATTTSVIKQALGSENGDDNLKIPTNYLPNFNHPLKYKVYKQNYDKDTNSYFSYLIFMADKSNNRLYVLEVQI